MYQIIVNIEGRRRKKLNVGAELETEEMRNYMLVWTPPGNFFPKGYSSVILVRPFNALSFVRRLLREGMLNGV